MALEAALYYPKGIVGSNTKGGRDESSAVIEFEHEVYSPTDDQRGIVSGARVHGNVILTKEIDTASPSLYQACCNGETLDESLREHPEGKQVPTTPIADNMRSVWSRAGAG